MKTRTIKVTTQGEGMEEALRLSEKVGNSCELTKKEQLRLRLLSEELFGMIRSITGETQADYWLEFKNKSFAVHLKAEVRLTQEMYEELIEVSTNRKNKAVRGFMGNIINMIEVMMLPQAEDYSMVSIGFMSLGNTAANYAGSGAYTWSMNQYVTKLEEGSSSDEDMELARDDLEKSIVAKLSDEVTVSISGSVAEITIYKAF